MRNKTITMTNNRCIPNVDLHRWTNDPNFYKVHDKTNNEYLLVNVSHIIKIEDYIEPDLSESKTRTY